MRAPERIRSVWLLTFEHSGVATVGGLGAAVGQYAEALARRGLDVTVLMPSHWRHLVRDRPFPLHQLDFRACGVRRGLDGGAYPYCLGADAANLGLVKLVLFKGLDTATGLVFDRWYPYENVEEKAALFARGVVEFAARFGLPDLIHANDWHSALAGVALRDYAERAAGAALPLVFTIHLSSGYSFPWHYASPDWAGLPDREHLVWRVCCHQRARYSDVWNEAGGSVERFAALEADALSSVSWGYLNEILSKYGEWLRGKSCVVYNATDWTLAEAEAGAERYGGRLEPMLEELSRLGPLVGRLNLDGALFLAVGRLTGQKGLDLAVRALDRAPSARLLILGVPVGDAEYEAYLEGLIGERPGRVALSKARVPRSLYMALHRASTALVMPSRWEPFGISAIEAMAVGTPVIASSVGGLPEVVADFRGGGGGTGLLVPPESEALGVAMESLANWLWRYKPEAIPDGAVRALAERLGPNYVNKLRSYIASYVDGRFREGNIYEQLMTCYEKARRMAFWRAVTR